jgi:hypothetical protein
MRHPAGHDRSARRDVLSRAEVQPMTENGPVATSIEGRDDFRVRSNLLHALVEDDGAAAGPA